MFSRGALGTLGGGAACLGYWRFAAPAAAWTGFEALEPISVGDDVEEAFAAELKVGEKRGGRLGAAGHSSDVKISSTIAEFIRY